MADLGITGLPTNYSEIENSIQNGITRIMYNNIPITNYTNGFNYDYNLIYAKNISDLQKLLDVTLLNRINKALLSLNVTELDTNFIFNVNLDNINKKLNIPQQGITISFGLPEVYAYDAILSLLGGLINFVNAHNVDFDIKKYVNMVNSSNIVENFYNPFNDSNYPNFGKLHSDGIIRYSNSKNLLLRALDKTDKGFYYLINRTNDGKYYVIQNLQINYEVYNIFSNFIKKFKSSLNGNYEYI